MTIWFVHEAGHIYLQAGKDGNTDWYRNLIKNPDVKLEFGKVAALGQARPIDDPNEAGRVHALFRRKYWLSRVMSWFGGGFGAGKVVRVDLVDLLTT